jgi:hypothetical protein
MLKNCSLDVKHQSINQLKRKQIVALSNYILRAINKRIAQKLTLSFLFISSTWKVTFSKHAPITHFQYACVYNKFLFLETKYSWSMNDQVNYKFIKQRNKHTPINQSIEKKTNCCIVKLYTESYKQKNRTKIDIVILFRTLGLFCVYIVCQHFLMLVVFYIVDLCK